MSSAVLAALLLVLPARAETMKASRDPDKGCAWRTLSDKALGLSLLVEKCDFGYRTVDYVADAKDKAVYELVHYTAPGNADLREPVILMFSKTPAETVADAIRRVAAPKAPAKRRARCRPAPAKHVELPAGREAYQYAPEDEDKLIEDAGGDIPDLPCGEWGLDFDSEAYFEYHPAQSAKRFALVFIGQDTPLFDEKSLTFLP